MNRHRHASITETPTSPRSETTSDTSIVGPGTASSEFAQPSPIQAAPAPPARVELTVSKADRWIVRRLLAFLEPAPLRIRLWSGEEFENGSNADGASGYDAAKRNSFGHRNAVRAKPASKTPLLCFHTRRSLWRAALDPDLAFGEGYMDGTIEVDGDLVALLTTTSHALAPRALPRPGLRQRLVALGRSTGKLGARKNASHHYEIGNDFYERWLDASMTYTCAYFETPEMGLAEAQQAKLALVCRKVGLSTQDRVIDAGCGWGSLAMFAARTYGVRVRAFNVAGAQLDWARAKARREGLGHLVEFVEDDYRNISGTCDVFLSVGLLEAVGKTRYAGFGRLIRRSLTQGGRGLVHSIGRMTPFPTNAWIDRYIFPGGYTPSLGEMMGVFEAGNLRVRHIENLREHYVRTLAIWRENFEAATTEIEAERGERFVRMWRLYLAAAEAGFAAGWMDLFQVAFTRER